MIEINFDKLYRYPRIAEPCTICIPVEKGKIYSKDNVCVMQDGKPVPTQAKVTSRYDDTSIRYLFVRFMADLPANKGTKVYCELDCKDVNDNPEILCTESSTGIEVDTGALKFKVEDYASYIFKEVNDGNKIYTNENFAGPYLKEADGTSYDIELEEWNIIECGQVCVSLCTKGVNVSKDKDKKIEFEIRINAYAGKPWVELSYRIINTSMEELDIASLVFYAKADSSSRLSDIMKPMNFDEKPDSTGCGDIMTDNTSCTGPVFHTRGTHELELFDEKAPVLDVRTMVGSSNYRTDFYIGKNGEEVNRHVDAHYLMKEANEHFAEVLYGTFFADRTDAKGGLCITVYQAQQNYPKAVKSDSEGIAVMLVPEGEDKVIMQPGMARTQKVLMHFHAADEKILEIDNRSLIYQMPDRPYISPEMFKNAGVMPDIFPDKLNDDVEMFLIGRADEHARCYGMLNWGDTWDSNYTQQGRGNGKTVWSNNEYDYPHSCALEYARTGVRRFLDYLLVSTEHQMDVDVCHYSDNPLRIGGQWEHTAGHCKNGIMVCSHEWVEGLIDYYHFTGDERALTTAVGIGNNILKLLDTPMYAVPGEANARETGWALRALTALYVETGESKWIDKCEWIVDSFKKWEEEYGYWLAPYTDNTTIRVGFMISVAIGSVMRYYRVFPREDIKDMIIRAVDDLIENCMLGCGVFYYKELPSLQRLGNNTLLLESLAIAYELTGDVKYLKPGIKTFDNAITSKAATTNGAKKIVDDAVICAGASTKGFAQSFIPVITYYKALSENELY